MRLHIFNIFLRPIQFSFCFQNMSIRTDLAMDEKCQGCLVHPGAMCCPNSSPGPPITWPGGLQMLNFYSRTHMNQIFWGHPGRFIESSGGTDGHAEIWLGIRFSTPGPPGTWYQVAGVRYHVPGTMYVLVFDYGESNNHVVFLLLKA